MNSSLLDERAARIQYVGPAGNLRAVFLFPLRRQLVKPRLRYGSTKWSEDRRALSVETAESAHTLTQRFTSLM